MMVLNGGVGHRKEGNPVSSGLPFFFFKKKNQPIFSRKKTSNFFQEKNPVPLRKARNWILYKSLHILKMLTSNSHVLKETL